MKSEVNEVISISQTDIPEVVRSHEAILKYSLSKFGHRRGLTYPLFLSVPGAGKSESGRALATELGRRYFEERAGNLMPGDTRIPAVDIEKQIARYCGNAAYPFVNTGVAKSDDQVLFVWDEMLDASPIIQKIVKQATNDNCIGDLVFPDDTLHVAFANGLEHGCNSERLAASNANRTAFYEVKVDVAGFQTWLTRASISPEAEALVSANLDMFYNIDFSKWDGKSNFASFRSVTEMAMLFASQYIREDGENRVFDFSDPLCSAKLNAILGPSSAAKAYAWLELFESIGSIASLLEDPHNCLIPDDISKKWIIASKLVGEASVSNLAAVMTIANRLLGSGSFLEAYVGRSICKTKPSLSSYPAISRWMQEDVLNLCNR